MMTDYKKWLEDPPDTLVDVPDETVLSGKIEDFRPKEPLWDYKHVEGGESECVMCGQAQASVPGNMDKNAILAICPWNLCHKQDCRNSSSLLFTECIATIPSPEDHHTNFNEVVKKTVHDKKL